MVLTGVLLILGLPAGYKPVFRYEDEQILRIKTCFNSLVGNENMANVLQTFLYLIIRYQIMQIGFTLWSFTVYLIYMSRTMKTPMLASTEVGIGVFLCLI